VETGGFVVANRIGGPPGPPPKNVGQGAETTKAQEVKAQTPAQRASAPDLPKVQKGLAKLAQSQGWENKEKALDVLVRAMATTAAQQGTPANLEAVAAKYRQQLRAAKLKKSKKLGKTDLEEAKEDADSLLTLAVVALGDEDDGGGKGGKRRDRDQQLLLDLDELHTAVVDVLSPEHSGKAPQGGAQAALLSRAESLAWASTVISRGKAAFEGAHIKADARVEALAGILRILAKYAEE
jgi:hypothetical protein